MTNTRNPISPAGARWLSRPTTDVGAATPPPAWCLPGTEPEWERLTKQYGGGAVCMWSRYFPPDNGGLGADVWIQCEDRIVDGRVLRSAPRLMLGEPCSDCMTPAQARQFAAELLNAADVLDELTD